MHLQNMVTGCQNDMWSSVKYLSSFFYIRGEKVSLRSECHIFKCIFHYFS